jgi:hypothetical protein
VSCTVFPPLILSRNQQTEPHLILRPEPRNRRSYFEYQNQQNGAVGFKSQTDKPEATDFKAKSGEIVATDFEVKLRETVPLVLSPNH